MSFYCPLCNGIQQTDYSCPNCKSLCEDCGRFGDFMGPYSPYRPIDDIKLTNGFLDLQHHQCIHVFYCNPCSQSYTVTIFEWETN